MVDGDGRVVILDFGLASAWDVTDPFNTVNAEIAGTPEYMSPEQAAGKLLEPASDWYAVGVVLYEILCGTIPFSGKRLQIMHDKQSAIPVRPSLYNSNVPSDLDLLCMELLAVDPKDRPTGDEIIKRLSRRTAGARSMSIGALSTRPSLFVGRARELKQLHDAWKEVRSSANTVVRTICGESGIGKTALVNQFLRELRREPGVVILQGRCYERETVPYKALDPVIDELSRFLSRLTDRDVAQLLPRDVHALCRVFPVLKRVPAVSSARGRDSESADVLELQRRAARALRELFVRLADTRPLALLIDDLHWGDTDSAHMLCALLEPPEAPALLMVGCTRDYPSTGSEPSQAEDANAKLRKLSRNITLSELDMDTTTELAQTLLGDRFSERTAAIVASETSGNPFMVHELALHLRGDTGLEAPSSDHAAHILKFAQAVERRVSALPSAARTVVELVAVAGTPVRESTLARGVRGNQSLSNILLQLRDVRLVCWGPPPERFVECYHDRIRTSVLDMLSADQVSRHHRDLARALEETAGDPEAIFEHYRAAGEGERAREHVITSARAADRALAFERAARLYRLALELSPSDARERTLLHRALADALAHHGRLWEAAREYHEAANLSQGMEALELLRLSAQHYLTSGYAEEGLPILRQALSRVGVSFPESSRSILSRIAWERTKLRLLRLRFKERQPDQVAPIDIARIDVCFSAAVGLNMTDMTRAAAFSAQHLRLALKAGEPHRIARGLTFELGIAPATGTEGMQWAQRALPVAEQLSERHGTAYNRGLFAMAQGHVAHLDAQWGRAVECLKRADEIFREAQNADVRWGLLTSGVIWAISAVMAGELPELSLRLPGLLRDAHQIAGEHGAALFTYPRVFVELAADRPEAARALCDAAARKLRSQTFQFRDFTVLQCQLLIDRYSGEHVNACSRMNGAWPLIEQSQVLLVNIVRIAALAGRAGAALSGVRAGSNSSENCLRVAQESADRLSRERLPFAKAWSKVISASIDAATGDARRAADTLSETIKPLDAAGVPLLAESARRGVGTLKGGNLGLALVRDAEAALAKRGVKNPARFVQMMVPIYA